MFNSQINPVLLTVIWTRDELSKALEDIGVPATDENIEAFIDEGGMEDLKGQLNDYGLDVLHQIIKKHKAMGTFKSNSKSK